MQFSINIHETHRLTFHCTGVRLLCWKLENDEMVTDEFQQNTQPLTISSMKYPPCSFLYIAWKFVVLKIKCCVLSVYGKVNYWLYFMAWSTDDYIYMNMSIIHLCKCSLALSMSPETVMEGDHPRSIVSQLVEFGI
jgi:hypothetical protein